MNHQLLVGQNILEKGKFLIDPSIQEGEEVIDWDMLEEEFKDVELPLEEDIIDISDEQLIQELNLRLFEKTKNKE